MQTDNNFMHFYKLGADGDPVQATAQELKDHLIQSRCQTALRQLTKTMGKLMAPGTGRPYTSEVIWGEKGPFSLPDQAAKRMLQCVTNTFPTQARLHLIGLADTGKCLFCSENVDETLHHWQLECVQFADARTRVHHDIWAAVSAALCLHLPKGWTYFHETPASTLFPGLHSSPALQNLQPDGIFLCERDVRYVMVDFTRGMGPG